jgi:Fic family protein
VHAPPFSITPTMLNESVSIGEALGQLKGLAATRPQPKLRRANRVRTIQGTVAIEGNRLSTEQVTAVLEGKRVLGSRKEVLEVQNTIAAYERAPRWRPWSQKDLLAAHGVLMKGLLPDAGRWRKGGVGILQGSKVAHIAPPSSQLPRLMPQLLEWGARVDVPMLIKACAVHYEIQFIHPFSDGNGRLGRLWQHVILLRVSSSFEFVPFESVIRARQSEYYAALRQSDRAGECTQFVEFALSATREALVELLRNVRPEKVTPVKRLDAAHQAFAMKWFTRSDYLKLHKKLSTASASRDLKEGVRLGRLKTKGQMRMTQYAFRN